MYNNLFIPLNPKTFLIIVIPNFSCRNIKLTMWTKVNRDVKFYVAIIVLQNWHRSVECMHHNRKLYFRCIQNL